MSVFLSIRCWRSHRHETFPRQMSPFPADKAFLPKCKTEFPFRRMICATSPTFVRSIVMDGMNLIVVCFNRFISVDVKLSHHKDAVCKEFPLLRIQENLAISCKQNRLFRLTLPILSASLSRSPQSPSPLSRTSLPLLSAPHKISTASIVFNLDRFLLVKLKDPHGASTVGGSRDISGRGGKMDAPL